ncbi:hypothetical protein HDV62DRAFT_178284 [Trichoderma sp. SZMC 28011]
MNRKAEERVVRDGRIEPRPMDAAGAQKEATCSSEWRLLAGFGRLDPDEFWCLCISTTPSITYFCSSVRRTWSNPNSTIHVSRIQYKTTITIFTSTPANPTAKKTYFPTWPNNHHRHHIPACPSFTEPSLPGRPNTRSERRITALPPRTCDPPFVARHTHRGPAQLQLTTHVCLSLSVPPSDCLPLFCFDSSHSHVFTYELCMYAHAPIGRGNTSRQPAPVV